MTFDVCVETLLEALLGAQVGLQLVDLYVAYPRIVGWVSLWFVNSSTQSSIFSDLCSYLPIEIIC